jgi:RecJ-like exonuclease
MATCESCHGDGHVDCPQCEGHGYHTHFDPAAALDLAEPARDVDCRLCNGSGRRKCEACDGAGERD